MHPRAAELIDTLELRPHPEGGFFRETFRSTMMVSPPDERGERAALTTIAFLLPQGHVSRWHKVASDEVWQLFEGGPLELLEFTEGERHVERHMLGPPGGAGHPTSHAIRAGHWQAARTRAGYALAGCSVAPGFEFADFRLMSHDPEAANLLRAIAPDLADLI